MISEMSNAHCKPVSEIDPLRGGARCARPAAQRGVTRDPRAHTAIWEDFGTQAPVSTVVLTSCTECRQKPFEVLGLANLTVACGGSS